MKERLFSVFLDGACIESNLTIDHLINRGLKFGDGIFETMRVSASEILYWQYHQKRLLKGCKLLNLEIGTEEEFISELESILKKSILIADQKLLRVRLSVVRNGGGAYAPEQNDVILFIELESVRKEKPHPINLKILDEYPIIPSPLTAIKSLNRLTNVLGMLKYPDNAVLINDKGRIVETLNGNIFFIEKDDITIVTPPISEGAIEGVMRSYILDKVGSIVERPITVKELSDFSACFSTNVLKIITKVASINEVQYDTTHPLILEILLRL